MLDGVSEIREKTSMNFDFKHFFLSVINFDLMNINELPWKFIIVKFHGFSFVKGKTKDKLKQLSLGQTPTLYPFPHKKIKSFSRRLLVMKFF